MKSARQFTIALVLAVAGILSTSFSALATEYLVSLRGTTDAGPNRIVRLGADGTYLGVFLDGGDVADLSGPTGLTLGPDNFLYVASAFNNKVLKVDLQTKAVTDLGLTGLTGPSGVAFDVSGNIYVTNIGDPAGTGTTVSKYTPSGALIASNFGSGYGGPTTPLFGQDGTLYVSNVASLVQAVDAAGNATPLFPAVDGPYSSAGLAFGPNGNLYVSDPYTGGIFQHDGSAYSLVTHTGDMFFPGPLLFADGESFIVGSTGVGTILYYANGSAIPTVFQQGAPDALAAIGFVPGTAIGGIIAVPEPNTGILLGGGLGLLAFLRRRRKFSHRG